MRSAVVVVAFAACTSTSAPEERIVSIEGAIDGLRYGFTEDSLIIGHQGTIEERDLDGVLIGTIYDGPFLQLGVGHGWVTWADLVPAGTGGFTARLFRRNANGAIEEAIIPATASANVDWLVPTPTGIVIDDPYSPTLWFWPTGTSTVEPLVLDEADINPRAFDGDWLYAMVDDSTRIGSVMRFSLDGTRKELVVADGIAIRFAVS
jgi:hypothetical protein